MTDLLLAQLPTVQVVPGGDVLSPNPVVNPNDWSDDLLWSNGGGARETPDFEPGPFGAEFGNWQLLTLTTVDSSGSWDQSVGLMTQQQCCSCYFKLSGLTPRADQFGLQLISSFPFVQIVATFDMAASGVVTLNSVNPAGTVTGIEHVGDGVYRCWISLDVDSNALIDVGKFRNIRPFIAIGAASDPARSILAYGMRVDSGTMIPLDHLLPTEVSVTTADELDLVLKDGDLVLDETLQTPALVSMFSDARAEDGEAPEFGDLERRGFWADTAIDRFGSKLWFLARSKVLPSTLLEAERWTEDSLSWLVRDSIAEAVAVTASDLGAGRIALEVSVTRGSALRHAEVWDALESAALDAPGVRLRLVFR